MPSHYLKDRVSNFLPLWSGPIFSEGLILFGSSHNQLFLDIQHLHLHAFAHAIPSLWCHFSFFLSLVSSYSSFDTQIAGRLWPSFHTNTVTYPLPHLGSLCSSLLNPISRVLIESMGLSQASWVATCAWLPTNADYSQLLNFSQPRFSQLNRDINTYLTELMERLNEVLDKKSLQSWQVMPCRYW